MTATDIHGETTLGDVLSADDAAVEQALADDGKLASYDDGKPWHPRVAAEEIHGLLGIAEECYYEIGRRLLKAKVRLPHGQFTPWIEDNFQFTARTARRWMYVTTARLAHPKLNASAAALGMKQIEAIAKLPPELVDEFDETGEVGGLTVEQMASLPYAKLIKALRRDQRAKTKAEIKAEEFEAELETRKQELKDLRAQVGLNATAFGEQARKQIEKVKGLFDEAMGVSGMTMSALAERMDELDPRTRSEVRAFAHYIENYAQLEACNLRNAMGEHVLGDEWPMEHHRDVGAQAVYPLPEGRIPTEHPAAVAVEPADGESDPEPQDPTTHRIRKVIELEPGAAGGGVSSADAERIEPYTDLVGKVSDEEIAQVAEVSPAAVAAWRAEKGIPSVTLQTKRDREALELQRDLERIPGLDLEHAKAWLEMEAEHDEPRMPVVNALHDHITKLEAGE